MPKVKVATPTTTEFWLEFHQRVYHGEKGLVARDLFESRMKNKYGHKGALRNLPKFIGEIK